MLFKDSKLLITAKHQQLFFYIQGPLQKIPYKQVVNKY